MIKVVAKYIHNNEGFIALFNELLGYNLVNFGIRHPHFGYALFSKEDTAVKMGKITYIVVCSHTQLG